MLYYINSVYTSSYIEQLNMLDWEMAPHGSSPGRTYRYYTGKPLFWFGHGLSYSEFSLALEKSE